MENRPEVYTEHEGTVRVSGSTLPKQAACCAYSYLQKGIERIDFFYIGANAGHQAMKAMTILSFMIRGELQDIGCVCFEPIRVLTNTVDMLGSGEVKEKDATVWRVVLIRR